MQHFNWFDELFLKERQWSTVTKSIGSPKVQILALFITVHY